VPKLLLRASKSPFSNFTTGSVPHSALLDVHKALSRPGTKNIGNLLFANAAHKALSAPDVSFEFDDYRLTFDPSFAEEADWVNENFDAFVLPMDNSFRLNFAENLAMATRTIERLTVPVVVTGVGAQGSLDGDMSTLEPIRDEVTGFVAAVLDRSQSIGVRGGATRDYLVSLGFPADRVDVIGCPSMYYRGERFSVSKKGPLGPVAVNLTNVAAPGRLRPFADHINEHPEGITYVPQIRALMPGAYRQEQPDRYAKSVDAFVPNLLGPDHLRFYVDFLPWLDFLATQSFAIGTRIHGNVAALLSGTPAHVIAHDSRTLELARYFDIPVTQSSDLGDFDLRRTYEESDYTALNENYSRRLATYAQFLERNGLQHILYDEAAIDAYDHRLRESLAEARLPSAPVKPVEPVEPVELVSVEPVEPVSVRPERSVAPERSAVPVGRVASLRSVPQRLRSGLRARLRRRLAGR